MRAGNDGSPTSSNWQQAKSNRKVQREWDRSVYKARHLIERFFASFGPAKLMFEALVDGSDVHAHPVEQITES
ncbi:MAG: hypothetical protein ACREO8_13410 [Luteimonas sp.]